MTTLKVTFAPAPPPVIGFEASRPIVLAIGAQGQKLRLSKEEAQELKKELDQALALSTLTIGVGDRVRSYDFEGRSDCYVEGVVTGFKERDSCTRYVIEVDTEVFEGKPVDKSSTRSKIGELVFPPVNGTPTTLGGTCNGVIKL